MAVRLVVGDHPPRRCTAFTHEVRLDVTRDLTRRTAVPADPRTPGRSHHEPVRVTRVVDALSPVLAHAAASGARLESVRIEVTRPSDDGREAPWYTIALDNVLVTALLVSWDDDVPLETITLDYGAITWSFDGDAAASAQWTVHPPPLPDPPP